MLRSFSFAGHQYTVKNYDRVATDLYVDQPLTNVSIKYSNLDYIADKCLKSIGVRQETGLIYKYGLQNFALKDLARDDLSESKKSSYAVDTDTTYRIINYALSDAVTQSMRDAAVSPMQPDVDTTEFLTDILNLNKEYLTSSALFNTTTFASYYEALSTSASRYRWNDYINSAPLDDAAYAKDEIRKNSGAGSKIDLVIGADVWLQLENHPDVRELYKYTQAGIITQELVAKAMKVDNLYVGNAVYNSANEGQTATLANVWGKFALFYHNPAVVGLRTAASAVIIDGGNVVRKWNEPRLRGADLIEVEQAFQTKVISARSGYLFSTAVS